MAAIRTLIESTIYFQGVHEADLTFISEHSLRRAFSAGVILFLEGEPAEGLWIVEAGHVKIFKVSAEGSEHILHLCGPGATFNDIGALDNGPNPASASALSPEVTVWFIPVAIIQEVLARNPVAALNVVRLLANRVRTLVAQIEDLALYSVTVRLARLLLRQAEDPSLSGPGVTRAALAGHINTTPQTVSQLLRSLESAGAIKFDRQHILIVNEALLRTIAQTDAVSPSFFVRE